MHYSGILIVTLPGQLEDCIRATEASGLAEVYDREPRSNRFIAVIESEHMEEQTDRLQHIRSVPGILMAELVYYHHDTEIGTVPDPRGVK